MQWQQRDFEKDVTLGVALKLGKLLKDSLPSLKVLYTRTTDKSLKLWERPNLANDRQADLFISIHCNANPNKAAAGSETYFMGLHKSEGNLEVAKRENSVLPMSLITKKILGMAVLIGFAGRTYYFQFGTECFYEAKLEIGQWN